MFYSLFRIYSRLPVFLQHAIYWHAMSLEVFELAWNLADHMTAAADPYHARLKLARESIARIKNA